MTIDKNGNAVFEKNIEEINDGPDFKQKKELKTLIIPETVKKIGRYVFDGCENLEKLVLPDGLEFIGRYAFARCSRLKSFVMPDSIKEIEENAFEYVRLAEPVYNADKSILYIYKETCYKDTITLPDSVKRIFAGAFTKSVFENIILSDNLEQIDSDAFFNCILCKKITVHCSADKIQDGAFRKFHPVPEFCFVKGAPDFSEVLRIRGESMLKRADELDIPTLPHSQRSELEKLVSECCTNEPETITKVAEFFLSAGEGEFFDAAANFWYCRARIYGSKKAAEILKEKCNREQRELPAVAWPVIWNESGERLYALGFSFFDKKRSYQVSFPDKNRIIEVTAYAGSDGPDEDGFGREEYYDWWLLDENLKEIPDITGIFGYSNHDKRTNEEKFKKRYDKAVDILKCVNAKKEAYSETFQKQKNRNS